ncbi:ubiquitin-like small modifier protein 1 [Halobacteriales archaeon Cl-PHB]
MDIVVYGPLRGPVGGKRTTIDVEGETVADALQAFVETYPGTADQLYAADGSLRPSVRVTHDGERLEPDEPCPDGGELALVPAMRGG